MNCIKCRADLRLRGYSFAKNFIDSWARQIAAYRGAFELTQAVLNHSVDVSTNSRGTTNKTPTTTLEHMWQKIIASRQASADREVARVLRIFDDNALLSLGYDAEDIERLIKR